MKKNYCRTIGAIGALFLFLGASATLTSSASRTWADNFDTYTNGQLLDGTPDDGGWKGWDNDPQFYGTVTNEQSISTPHSVKIELNSDLIHEYEGYTSGQWVYTAWQFVPTDFAGESYFMLFSSYTDGAGSNNKWALVIRFDSINQIVESEADAVTTPLITGQWIELRTEIDLDSDWFKFYYNDYLLIQKAWTACWNNAGDGFLVIDAVDLFANTASKVFYDDMSLVPMSNELVCSAGGPYEGDVDEEIQFTGFATGGVEPYTWHWDFGDGEEATEQNPTHAYTEAGVFNVTLTVTDDEGTIATDTTTATIVGPQPVIGIGEITGGLLKVNAVVQNTGTGDAADIDWSIKLTGGLIILGKETTGTIASLAAGGEETITSSLILGLGATTITVTAGPATKNQEATVLLIFIKI
ncbi:MAG: hypothetical protein BV458_09535 [Thermoplasmata archaeon M9B2D]|nr:MAG: hypothetical protein BV458_09535 [Thermoplasmata archaeon M9B2D]